MKVTTALLVALAFLFTSCQSSHFGNLDYKPLFQVDSDLSENWTGNLKGYSAKGGIITTKDKAGSIYTKKEYQDYVLKFDFKLPEGANNGLGLRAPYSEGEAVEGDIAYSTVEVQILDNFHSYLKDVPAKALHGSAHGLEAALKGSLKPVGEWNTQEVYLKKNHLIVRLNDKVILDANLSESTPSKSRYGSEKVLGAGRNRGAGHIAFSGAGSKVQFRNIAVSEIEDDYSLLDLPDNTAPEGFTALFNGKDLTNWKGLLLKPNDKPHVRAALKKEDRTKLQRKADEVMRRHWTIENGVLFFDGEKGGFSLATNKQYGNFEFYCSYKIEPNSDSGIYLRGLPQVQIWDPENKGAHKHGADKGSGGLWNNKKEGRWPLVKADKPAGQWNHFFIRMIGDSVTIWLNGKLIVNDAPLENLWQKGQPIPVKEQIELQCHGDPISFKNIYIKELP